MLSDPARSADSEQVAIPSPDFDLTDPSDILASVYLNDFTAEVAGAGQQWLGIDASSVRVHNGSVQLVLHSHVGAANTVSAVTFAVLLVRRSGYPHFFFHLHASPTVQCQSQANCSSSLSLTTRVISPSTVAAEACLFGLFSFRTGSLNTTVKSASWQANGSSV